MRDYANSYLIVNFVRKGFKEMKTCHWCPVSLLRFLTLLLMKDFFTNSPLFLSLPKRQGVMQ